MAGLLHQFDGACDVAQAPAAATQFDSLLAAEQLQHMHQAEEPAPRGAAPHPAAVAATPKGEAAAAAQSVLNREDAAAAMHAIETPTKQQVPGAVSNPGPLCSWVSITQQDPAGPRVRR
jgi:hypothetical protein